MILQEGLSTKLLLLAYGEIPGLQNYILNKKDKLNATVAIKNGTMK